MKKVISNTVLACLLSFGLVGSLEAAILGGGADISDGVQLTDYLGFDTDNNGFIDYYKYLVVDQSAGVNTATYSGTYLGTIIDEDYSSKKPNSPLSANDSVDDLEALISYYLGVPYEIVTYLKAEEDNNFEDQSGIIKLSVLFNDPPTTPQTGTWTVTPDSYALDFYAVKGSNEFALYALYPNALSSGLWTTAHLINPGEGVGLSHFSGSIVNTPVPEPATMLLFGTGLAGLAAVARRRKN